MRSGSTDVVSGEFGGITQHIGAYQAHVNGREITFIDTPGHEAFTAMRARGAQITDIAVLVVAADDGVMPQTVEALDHARAAGVPVIVAVNKIDKEEADPNRVRTQMVERGLVPSEWGGDTEFVDVSAKTNANLEGLLETVLIVADLAELKGDPTGHARGTVLEAHLDKGRGPVATVLVQKGRLEVGDALVCGTTYCKVRAMVDENGQPVDVAGPAKPAQVLGWNGVPNVGDEFREVEDEREARHIAAERESRVRSAEVVNQRPASLAGAAPPPGAVGDPGAESGRQGGRPGLARRPHGRVPEAPAGRGPREPRALRRGSDHRARRRPREDGDRDRRRLQRPTRTRTPVSSPNGRAWTSGCIGSSTTRSMT